MPRGQSIDHVLLFVVSVAYDIMPKAKPSWIHRGCLFLYVKTTAGTCKQDVTQHFSQSYSDTNRKSSKV